MFRCQVINCEISILSCLPDSQICYIGFWALVAYLFLKLFFFYICMKSVISDESQGQQESNFSEMFTSCYQSEIDLYGTLHAFFFFVHCSY